MPTTVKTGPQRSNTPAPSQATRRVGFHVSIAGSVERAIPRAQAVGCTAMQIFTQSPRGGKPLPLKAEAVAAFDQARREADIQPLAVHTPYLINLASQERAVWDFSVRAYIEDVRRAIMLGADFVVTHVGSTKGKPAALGIERVIAAIQQTWDTVRPQHLTILLENTAGSGQGLGARFEELRAMLDGLRDQARVGVCLDTAHTFAAGYPIHTADGLIQTVCEIGQIISWDSVKLIHLNDSKVPFESKVDRHWHIGKGYIGVDGFRRILQHPRFTALPWILETPGETDADDLRNLKTVLKLSDRNIS